jgi:hypothetical protein
MNKLSGVKRKFLPFLALVLAIPLLMAIYSFCGFYVAQGGAKLFNKASQVIIAREGDKTVVTMSNDFSGDVKEFALVVPVPMVLRKDQIRVVEPKIFEVFDNYSAPRLVEYYDKSPCRPDQSIYFVDGMKVSGGSNIRGGRNIFKPEDAKTSVKIEAKYTVGEYDILILSATQADGLETWLKTNGYKIPDGAEKVLRPYIKNNFKFFVVKVNLKAQEAKGYSELRPIQIQYRFDKFMLPIRLGMANSTGFQDLVVYGLSSKGRIETANYRTLPIPTDQNIPGFVIENFGAFYQSVFEKAWNKAGRNIALLEYAWDLSPTNPVICDPCPEVIIRDPTALKKPIQQAAGEWAWSTPPLSNSNVYFTRLHLRYSLDDFPEDLMFIETNNTQNFQGRYIVTHMAKGDLSCEEGKKYMSDLADRQMKEIENYKDLVAMNTETDKPSRKEDLLPFGKHNTPTNRPPMLMLLLSLSLVAFLSIVLLNIIAWIKKQTRPSHETMPTR